MRKRSGEVCSELLTVLLPRRGKLRKHSACIFYTFILFDFFGNKHITFIKKKPKT